MLPVSLAGPAVEPIALAEAKAYLRLPEGEDEDELVRALITAGRLTVERVARLALIAQSWRVRLDRWPPGRIVPLPFWPILSVDAVRVAAGPAGAPAVLDPGLWRLDRGEDPARLLVDPAAPAPGRIAEGIEIDVTAGFGSGPASVPEPLRLAIRRLVACWFERRGDEPGGRVALPPDIPALLAPYSRPRLA